MLKHKMGIYRTNSRFERPKYFRFVPLTDLAHALAVSDFSVVHGVGSEDVKQRLLLDPISFSEHDVITVGSIHVQIDLTNVVRVLARAKPHRLVNAVLLLVSGKKRIQRASVLIRFQF